MRVDPIRLLAQDYLIAATALEGELRRLQAADRLDDLPDEARRHIAHLARRGSHRGVTIARLVQPRTTGG